MKTIFLIALVLSLILSSGCAAVQLPSNYAPPLLSQVYYVFPATVARAVEACRMALHGTSIYTDGIHYVFIQAREAEQTAVIVGTTLKGVVVDISETVKNGGNLVNAKSVKEVIDSLTAHGYNKVDPTAVPFLTAVVGVLKTVPMMVISPAAIDGDIDQWFEDTFLPMEVKG